MFDNSWTVWLWFALGLAVAFGAHDIATRIWAFIAELVRSHLKRKRYARAEAEIHNFTTRTSARLGVSEDALLAYASRVLEIDRRG